MFGFLKKKIGEVVSKFSKKVESEVKEDKTEGQKEEIKVEEQEIEVVKEEKVKEVKKRKSKKETLEKTDEKTEPVKDEEKEPEIIEEVKVEEPEEKGFWTKFKEKVTSVELDEKRFNEFFNQLEIALLESNVAFEVIDKLRTELKDKLLKKKIPKTKIENEITQSLSDSIRMLFNVKSIDVLNEIKEKEKPYVIVFFGLNGSGKTSTIAKFGKYLLDNKLKSVFAAADTFRSAAIQQLEEHGNKLGIKVIKHDYKSDPAAVAFDAVKFGKAHNLDVVLIDTAGRQDTNLNLMEEMKKIVRVVKPNLKIFVGEAISGGGIIETVKRFDDAVGIDGIILTKVDVDKKGGAFVGVEYSCKKPILFISNGQDLDKFKIFNKDEIVESIGL